MKAVWTGNGPEMYLVPDSAVIWRGNPWFVPMDGKGWRAFFAIGAVIDRLGTHIPERFATRYFDSVVVCAHPSPTTTDNPWAEWWRDGALECGDPVKLSDLDESLNLVCDGQTLTLDREDLTRRIVDAIVRASAFATLKTGDMVLVELPLSPIPLAERVDFTVTVNDRQMLKFKTR